MKKIFQNDDFEIYEVKLKAFVQLNQYQSELSGFYSGANTTLSQMGINTPESKRVSPSNTDDSFLAKMLPELLSICNNDESPITVSYNWNIYDGVLRQMAAKLGISMGRFNGEEIIKIRVLRPEGRKTKKKRNLSIVV